MRVKSFNLYFHFFKNTITLSKVISLEAWPNYVPCSKYALNPKKISSFGSIMSVFFTVYSLRQEHMLVSLGRRRIIIEAKSIGIKIISFEAIAVHQSTIFKRLAVGAYNAVGKPLPIHFSIAICTLAVIAWFSPFTTMLWDSKMQ